MRRCVVGQGDGGALTTEFGVLQSCRAVSTMGVIER